MSYCYWYKTQLVPSIINEWDQRVTDVKEFGLKAYSLYTMFGQFGEHNGHLIRFIVLCFLHFKVQ